MGVDEREAIRVLRERLPEFAPVIEEHLGDHEGDLFFYVLMGELAQFYVSEVGSDRESPVATGRRSSAWRWRPTTTSRTRSASR